MCNQTNGAKCANRTTKTVRSAIYKLYAKPNADASRTYTHYTHTQTLNIVHRDRDRQFKWGRKKMHTTWLNENSMPVN